MLHCGLKWCLLWCCLLAVVSCLPFNRQQRSFVNGALISSKYNRMCFFSPLGCMYPPKGTKGQGERRSATNTMVQSEVVIDKEDRLQRGVNRIQKDTEDALMEGDLNPQKRRHGSSQEPILRRSFVWFRK